MGVKAESLSNKAGVSAPNLGITTTWPGILIYFSFFFSHFARLIEISHSADSSLSELFVRGGGVVAMTPPSLSSSVCFALCAPTPVTLHAARSPNIKDVRDALAAPRFPFFKKKKRSGHQMPRWRLVNWIRNFLPAAFGREKKKRKRSFQALQVYFLVLMVR